MHNEFFKDIEFDNKYIDYCIQRVDIYLKKIY